MRGWRDCRGDDERELATSYDEYWVESIFSEGLGATTQLQICDPKSSIR